jgi:hypothetical protein
MFNLFHLEPLQLLLCLEVQFLGYSASILQLVSSRNRKEMIGSAVVLCLLFAVEAGLLRPRVSIDPLASPPSGLKPQWSQ